MRIDLLKLKLKPIMPISRRNHHQLCLWYMCRNFSLLRRHEESIRRDADHRCAWRERGKHLDYGARVIRVGNTAPRYVMGIELARDVGVAVGVEPCGEFVALIPKGRLGGEDGWYLGGSVPARGFAFREPLLIWFS